MIMKSVCQKKLCNIQTVWILSRLTSKTTDFHSKYLFLYTTSSILINSHTKIENRPSVQWFYSFESIASVLWAFTGQFDQKWASLHWKWAPLCFFSSVWSEVGIVTLKMSTIMILQFSWIRGGHRYIETEHHHAFTGQFDQRWASLHWKWEPLCFYREV